MSQDSGHNKGQTAKERGYFDTFMKSPSKKLKVRRKSQMSPKTERQLEKRTVMLAKRVQNFGSATARLDLDTNNPNFLRKDSQEYTFKSKPGKEKQAPMNVIKNPDGFYVRRSLVGTPEQYQSASKFFNSLKKYNFNRKHISHKGELAYEKMLSKQNTLGEGDGTPNSLMSRLRHPRQFGSVKDLSTTNIT